MRDARDLGLIRLGSDVETDDMGLEIDTGLGKCLGEGARIPAAGLDASEIRISRPGRSFCARSSAACRSVSVIGVLPRGVSALTLCTSLERSSSLTGTSVSTSPQSALRRDHRPSHQPGSIRKAGNKAFEGRPGNFRFRGTVDLAPHGIGRIQDEQKIRRCVRLCPCGDMNIVPPMRAAPISRNTGRFEKSMKPWAPVMNFRKSLIRKGDRRDGPNLETLAIPKCDKSRK